MINPVDIFFFTAILVLCILLLLLKRQDVILRRYERNEEYRGFLQDVLKAVISTGGIFNPATILPWFDFAGKDEFERKHLVAKNWLLLFFILLLSGTFIIAYLISRSN